MKKIIIYAFVAITLMFSGCNDMLDKSPRDTFTNNTTFWSNANAVESYSNKFYDNYIGYNSKGDLGWFYFKSFSDDQVNPTFDDWTYKTIPSTSSDWTDGSKEIRRVNYLIQGLSSSSLTNGEKARFMAIGRLNRAWEYYQMVRKFGNMQWMQDVITDPDDNRIYGSRTDRDVVIDSVLSDLNYAVANLDDVSDKTAWSKQMALAMKSDVCLYEGTFCKYRTTADNGKAPDLSRAQKYLNESVTASEAIMNSGKFALSTNYGDIYNSLSLGSNKEIIFYRNYEKDMVMHSLVDYTCNSTEQFGISKDAFDAFLFLDGKPKANTTLNTDDKAVINSGGNYSVSRMLSQRDKRLSLLVDSIISFAGHGWARVNNMGVSASPQMTSSTGYTVRKYDNMSLDSYYRINIGTGYTDAPLYWYAVILLNEAEAKAELGTITQSDLDKTINLLQSRVGLKPMTLLPDADPANNMGVSNLLWEIRRCRRCELMTDNWYRYWDLVRWHQLDKLDTSKNPDIMLGANLSNISNVGVNVTTDKYMIGNTKTRTYDSKYYLYPIPTGQITLSPETGQNLGW
ncbi:RagB/SusD family nutrient uptake outer membrane protein [Prevotella herbatica]|uniref:RagB/SusD family nutrient uptake outer membrane protein n=1 Tax=Prevotella herbatica TaxID=2801997 RepID=A0ABM7NVQ0_9BACT|nr:RagB/SusD family nutrient uptake outer membrane protein [Prevotella herbatica]BCS84585.1 RagB/SusD family nutrient uptake outer membrane protein [Prevotella herbatica]